MWEQDREREHKCGIGKQGPRQLGSSKTRDKWGDNREATCKRDKTARIKNLTKLQEAARKIYDISTYIIIYLCLYICIHI